MNSRPSVDGLYVHSVPAYRYRSRVFYLRKDQKQRKRSRSSTCRSVCLACEERGKSLVRKRRGMKELSSLQFRRSYGENGGHQRTGNFSLQPISASLDSASALVRYGVFYCCLSSLQDCNLESTDSVGHMHKYMNMARSDVAIWRWCFSTYRAVDGSDPFMSGAFLVLFSARRVMFPS